MIDPQTIALFLALQENSQSITSTPVSTSLGNFELIETITLAEPTRTVVRDMRADTGEPYHLAAALIVVTGQSAYSNASVYWYGHDQILVAHGRLTTNATYSTVMRGVMVGGFMWAEGCEDASNSSTMVIATAGAKNTFCYPSGYIDEINLTCSSNMLAGTTIQIYGISSKEE